MLWAFLADRTKVTTSGSENYSLCLERDTPKACFTDMEHVLNLQKPALILVLFLGLAGLGVAIYELLSPASGTTGTAGAILVTASTALLTIAAALLAFVRLPGWIFGFLLALLLTDAVATLVAGYFLMSEWLVITMLGALIAVLFAAVSGLSNEKVST